MWMHFIYRGSLINSIIYCFFHNYSTELRDIELIIMLFKVLNINNIFINWQNLKFKKKKKKKKKKNYFFFFLYFFLLLFFFFFFF